MYKFIGDKEKSVSFKKYKLLILGDDELVIYNEYWTKGGYINYKERVKICSKENNSRNLSQFGLFISEDYEEPFFISLTNPSTGELILTTENTDFLYIDILIGFGGYFTTNDVYGFGERYHELKLGDGKFTMWPNDTSAIHEDTGEGGYIQFKFLYKRILKKRENLLKTSTIKKFLQL